MVSPSSTMEIQSKDADAILELSIRRTVSAVKQDTTLNMKTTQL